MSNEQEQATAGSPPSIPSLGTKKRQTAGETEGFKDPAPRGLLSGDQAQELTSMFLFGPRLSKLRTTLFGPEGSHLLRDFGSTMKLSVDRSKCLQALSKSHHLVTLGASLFWIESFKKAVSLTTNYLTQPPSCDTELTNQSDSNPTEDLDPWSPELIVERKYHLLRTRFSDKDNELWNSYALSKRPRLDEAAVNQINDDPRSAEASWAFRTYVAYKYRDFFYDTIPEDVTDGTSLTPAADKPAA